MRAILIALFAVLQLAGCSDGLSGQDLADAEAKDWDPAAQLVGIVAIEARDPDAMDQDARPDHDGLARALLPHADDTPGDGDAPAWAYVYTTGDAWYAVVTDSGEATFSAEVEEQDLDLPGGPLGPWDLSAQDAADLVAAKGWPEVEVAVTALGQEDGQENPGWVFVGFGDEGIDAIYMVDAVTGEVQDLSGFAGGF